MFFKCLLLFCVLVLIKAYDYGTYEKECMMPRFPHGRVRWRTRYRLARFLCYPRYSLVGNRYSTCKNGEWDVPWPVCVRSGCTVPKINNSLQVMKHNNAWMTIFCYPGYELSGSPALYCDGRTWNGTIPTCVETVAPNQLSCDFENPDLCGWKQDELHDFDWKRLNKKTPSSFLLTGPSYDHTFGVGGSGYYMYIESSSRLENDTARLISPVYDQSLANKGCFSFFYHMFGKYVGGLRVYQKPDSIPLDVLLNSTMKQNYTLFELWGNQGNTWYGQVSDLKNVGEDFQIVIEGIRGRSFTSDIAIDDVAILQGENCTTAKQQVTTPTVFLSESCEGRCDIYGTSPESAGTACGCTVACIGAGNCCPDFFESCVFIPDMATTDDDKASSGELPQTQKLVASNTTSPDVSAKFTANTKPPPTIPTTLTTKLTTYIKLTTAEPTTTLKTTKMPTVATATKIKSTKAITTVVKTTMSATTKSIKTMTTTTKVPVVTIDRRRVSSVDSTTRKPKTPKYVVTSNPESVYRENAGQSGLKTGMLIIAVMLCSVAGLWVIYVARSSRGRILIARLRGRSQQDPEVRYLHADTDE